MFLQHGLNEVFTCCLRTKPEPSLTASHSPPRPHNTLSSPPHPVTVQPELLPWQRSWPSAWPSPLTPGGLTFGLRIIRGEGGGWVSSRLKTVKALAWLAIIRPFRTPIYVIGVLTKWTFCTLLAATSPVCAGQSVTWEAAGMRLWCSLVRLLGVRAHEAPPCFHLSWLESADGGVFR